MRRTQPTRRPIPMAALRVAALAAILLPGLAAAERPADQNVGQLAAATVHAGGVDLLPAVAYSAAKITVSGNGMVYERSLGAGEPISVGLFDPEGELLPDGTYTWRLALTPTADAARELRRAAKRNGGIAPDRWPAETGVFTVRNGLMVDPGLVEAAPARRAAVDGYGALAQDLGVPTAAASRIADDTDDAVAAGASERRVAPTPGAGRDRADAEALAAGPAPERAIIDQQPTRLRSYPTDGKNGRE